MIHGIGIDIVHIPKFRQAVEKWGDRFKNRIFTQKELDYCNGRKFSEQHLAARFAAKEAFIKALGIGVKFRDIEILNNQAGKPYIDMAELEIQNPKSEIRNFKTHLTLSHDGDYSIAQVIIEV